MGPQEKMDKLYEIWCNWSLRMLTGDQAMMKIYGLFKPQIRAAWKKHSPPDSELRKKALKDGQHR